jgi:hypothetical protein
MVKHRHATPKARRVVTIDRLMWACCIFIVIRSAAKIEIKGRIRNG